MLDLATQEGDNTISTVSAAIQEICVFDWIFLSIEGLQLYQQLILPRNKTSKNKDLINK